jgi:hypothetical protein
MQRTIQKSLLTLEKNEQILIDKRVVKEIPVERELGRIAAGDDTE